MNSELGRKKPLKKDAEYRRKALMYSAILLILGLVGGLLLADRIVGAEAQMGQADTEISEPADDGD